MDQFNLQDLSVPILLITLVWASVTDIRDRLIPNRLMLVSASGGLAIAIAAGASGGAAVFGLMAATPFLVAALIRPEGMGMGDVKLVGVIGIFLGSQVWTALAVGLAVAGLAGILVSLGRRIPPGEAKLPLAPFLTVGVAAALGLGL